MVAINLKKISYFVFGLSVILNLSGCSRIEQTIPDVTQTIETGPLPSVWESEEAISFATTENDTINVHFLDVGQADCIVVENGDEAVVIDGGNNEDGSYIVEYMQNLGIDKVNQIIATHPHEDHIGGLDDIINSISCESIIMNDENYDSKTFEDLEQAIIDHDLDVVLPIEGNTFSLGNAEFTIIHPGVKASDDTNEHSICVRMDHGENSFLFMADATMANEQYIINQGLDIDVDVLKVGHHGSYTSTSRNFITAVTPEIAIIQVGIDNEYGHPHKGPIEVLETNNVNIYTTSELGDIILFSDMKHLTLSANDNLVQ